MADGTGWMTAWRSTPKWAALSAGWYWGAHGLNALADAGDMRTLTRRINGGWNGLDDRMAIYAEVGGAVGGLVLGRARAQCARRCWRHAHPDAPDQWRMERAG